MQSMLKLVHEEGLGLESVNLRDLATKYGVKSLNALAAAHNRAFHSGPGPFTFSAVIVTGGTSRARWVGHCDHRSRWNSALAGPHAR